MRELAGSSNVPSTTSTKFRSSRRMNRFVLLLRRKWIDQDLDSRVIRVNTPGRRELHERFGIAIR